MVTDELKELKTKMKIDESEQYESNKDLFMQQQKRTTAVQDFPLECG